MYKKSIVLLKNKPAAQIIRGFLHTKKKEIETESILLNDFDEIKKDISQNRNTSNLRKHFGNFIMKNGMPYLMMMDYRTDLGLPVEVDPDQLKILNTFLISFCILAHTPSHEHKTVNLVLLLDKADNHFKEEYIENPSLLFKNLKTQDERANSYINNIGKDAEKAKNLMNISTLFYTEGTGIASELTKLEVIIQNIDSRIHFIKQESVLNSAKAVLPQNMEPARVICRPTGEKIICNGEIRDISADEKEKYFGNYLSIEGAITQETARLVQKRVVDTLNATSRLKPIGKESKIVFMIPDTSYIDSSFTTLMGTFFVNLKSKYPGVLMDLGEKNLEKVIHSPGFIAVKGMLVKSV